MGVSLLATGKLCLPSSFYRPLRICRTGLLSLQLPGSDLPDHCVSQITPGRLVSHAVSPAPRLNLVTDGVGFLLFAAPVLDLNQAHDVGGASDLSCLKLKTSRYCVVFRGVSCFDVCIVSVLTKEVKNFFEQTHI